VYAVIETGGKQYKVSPGQKVDVELLGAAAGDQVRLERVLMIADGDTVRVGSPIVDGAAVVGTVVGEVKGDKIIVFRYKSKVRYRRKTGHRQKYTQLTIDAIEG